MNLTVRAKNILLQPAQEWAVIETESARVADLYRAYIVPLAAIGPVASIIGLSMVGIGGYRIPLLSSIGHAVVTFVMALGGVYVLALIIDALARQLCNHGRCAAFRDRPVQHFRRHRRKWH